MLSLMGGTGIIVPFLSIFVATFKGVSDLSLFNSSMLMVLSLLIIVFLLVKSIFALFTSDSKLFICGVLFIMVDIISVVFSLMTYLVL